MPDKKNYEILSGNTVVAVWQDGNLEVINKDLLPLFLKRISDADMWLETRAIDSHRANSRLLKKALRLAEKDDISTVAHVNAATITDNYWIRPVGSDLTFDDVRFTDDYFSNLALKGTYNSFNWTTEPTEGQYWSIIPQADGKVKILNLSVKKWWQYSTSYKSFGSYATAQDGAELPSLVAAE